jgi:hypothetical protein
MGVVLLASYPLSTPMHTNPRCYVALEHPLAASAHLGWKTSPHTWHSAPCRHEGRGCGHWYMVEGRVDKRTVWVREDARHTDR